MTYERLFGVKFNPLTKGMARPCSADDARRRHEDGRLYGVLLRDSSGANVVAADLNPALPGAWVRFFDERGRSTLEYVFGPARSRPGHLWLGRARFCEYRGDADEWVVNESWSTREDGTVSFARDDRESGTRTEKDGTREPQHLERHYEPPFAFGDFASLLRRDRDRPAPGGEDLLGGLRH